MARRHIGALRLGIDRVVLCSSRAKNRIREVIAFGKTAAAQDLMAESPSEVDKLQLDSIRNCAQGAGLNGGRL
jgi:aspartyl-tRNA synthetase